MKKKYVVIAICVLVVAAIVACGQIFTVRDISVVFYNRTGMANEADILEASGLTNRNNIFNVKEKDIKNKIADAFPDNSILVTNVERQFPDKIVLYVRERTLVFKLDVYSSSGENKCVLTDKDFQRGNILSEDEVSQKLIEVKGCVVHETFDIKECVALREIAKALVNNGVSEEALPYFIDTIEIVDDMLTITLAETNATLSVEMNSAYEQTAILYKEYIELTYSERNNAVLSVRN